MPSAPSQAPAAGTRRGGHMQVPNRYHEAKLSAGFTPMQRSILDVLERLTLGWRRESVTISASDIARRFDTRPTSTYYRAYGELVREGVVQVIDAGGGQTPHTLAISADFAHGWGRFSVSEQRLAAMWDIVPISFAPSAPASTPAEPSPAGTLSLTRESSPPESGPPALPDTAEGTRDKSLPPGQMDPRKDRKDRKDTPTPPARGAERKVSLLEANVCARIPEVYRDRVTALLDRVSAGGADLVSWICELQAVLDGMAGHHHLSGEQLGRAVNDFLGGIPDDEVPKLLRFRNFARPIATEGHGGVRTAPPMTSKADRLWGLIKFAGLHHKTSASAISAAVHTMESAGQVRNAKAFIAFLDTLDFRLLRDARTDKYAVDHIATKLADFRQGDV